MLKVRDVAAAEGGIALIAGKNGLDAPVVRTHMVENLEIAAHFVAEGELVFTTGAGLAGPSQQLQLVQAAWHSGACALVLNLGPYLPAVEPAVAAFAEEKDFPLFTCPWEVRMAEIMHRVSCRIEASEGGEGAVAAALKNAILRPDGWQQLMQLGFGEATRFRVAVCAPGTRFAEGPCHYFEIAGQSAAVFVGLEPADLRQRLRAGGAAVSGCCDLLTLGRGFEEARRLYRLRGGGEGLQFFEESGMLQLLLAVGDRQVLQRYCESALGPLLQPKNSGLLEVLDTYLRCGGSLNAAAAALGVHKNTVTNRLHRCEELLGVSTARPDVRLNLQAALLTRQVLQRGE